MAGVLIAAANFVHHDPRELASGLAFGPRASASSIAGHLDLQGELGVSYHLTDYDELEMHVEGEEGACLEFARRCREAGVSIKAVREDDETGYRLA